MASALGRCLLLAAAGRAPPGMAVVAVPDPELLAAHEEAKRQGLK